MAQPAVSIAVALFRGYLVGMGSTEESRSNLVPNLLTVVRIPLAGLIWIAPESPPWFLGVLAAAGVSDLLDGWLARRMRLARFRAGDPGGLSAGSNAGAFLDPIADKVFTTSAIIAAVVAYDPALVLVLAFLARELLLLPLFLFFKLVPGPWQRPYDYTAGWPGKVTTVIQFAALISIVVYMPSFTVLALLAGVFGLIAVVYYVRRGIRART